MPTLPCELLDHIVDILHCSQAPSQKLLRNCCLVSKSWVPSTRKHLFAEINFKTAKSLKSWKKTFPDPSTSPARYTKVLSIGGPEVVKTADVEGRRQWIKAFSRVVCLVMDGGSWYYPPARGWVPACILLRGISPVIKSLRVKHVFFSSPRLFDLILSFPLLEDLDVVGCRSLPVGGGGASDGLPVVVQQASSLPVFGGSLDLDINKGMGPIARRLLSLPGDIHFRKLTLKLFCEEDIPLTAALVGRCSHTLESLDITCNNSRGTSIGPSAPARK